MRAAKAKCGEKKKHIEQLRRDVESIVGSVVEADESLQQQRDALRSELERAKQLLADEGEITAHGKRRASAQSPRENAVAELEMQQSENELIVEISVPHEDNIVQCKLTVELDGRVIVSAHVAPSSIAIDDIVAYAQQNNDCEMLARETAMRFANFVLRRSELNELASRYDFNGLNMNGPLDLFTVTLLDRFAVQLQLAPDYPQAHCKPHIKRIYRIDGEIDAALDPLRGEIAASRELLSVSAILHALERKLAL